MDMFCSACKVIREGKYCSNCGLALKEFIDPVKNTWNPVGVWHVTTEGDVEGRSTKDLGVHEGHIVDIARALSTKVYYGLSFSPAKSLEEVGTTKPAASVNVSLDIKSRTWDLDGKHRVAYFQKMLQDRDDVKVTEGNYYACVKLEFINKPEPKSKTKTKAKEGCQFLVAWVGYCGKGTDKLCAEHKQEKCRCGKQAWRQCDNAGSLVCGAPLCGSCFCNH